MNSDNKIPSEGFKPHKRKVTAGGKVDPELKTTIEEEAAAQGKTPSNYYEHILLNRHVAKQLMDENQALKDQLESERNKMGVLNDQIESGKNENQALKDQLESESQKSNEKTEQLRTANKEIGTLKKQIDESKLKHKESKYYQEKEHNELKRKIENLENENQVLKREKIKATELINQLNKSNSPPIKEKTVRRAVEILHPSIQWDEKFQN